MRARRSIIIPAALLALATACGSSTTTQQEAATESAPRSLRLPSVPAAMTDPAERLIYVLDHYWDSMPWDDTAAVADTAFMEQTLVDYFELMALADSAASARGASIMLDAAARRPQALRRVAEIAERYLYSPESPMYRPESYAVVIDALAAVPSLPPDIAERGAHDHAEIMTNRCGTRATDFSYLTRSGSWRTLAHTIGVTAHTIVLFYDSDCNVCASVEAMLRDSQRINEAIAAGTLTVLAIDPFTPDEATWRTHAATLPESWTVGYAPAVDADELYILRSTPSLYLLDSTGRILTKDADAATLRSWTTP